MGDINTNIRIDELENIVTTGFSGIDSAIRNIENSLPKSYSCNFGTTANYEMDSKFRSWASDILSGKIAFLYIKDNLGTGYTYQINNASFTDEKISITALVYMITGIDSFSLKKFVWVKDGTKWKLNIYAVS